MTANSENKLAKLFATSPIGKTCFWDPIAVHLLFVETAANQLARDLLVYHTINSIYIYIYIYNLYIHTYTYVYIYMCMHLHIYICIYLYTHVSHDIPWSLSKLLASIT